ncbi:hypothetical protein CBL_20647 [Carabus blaptoides fortunei]
MNLIANLSAGTWTFTDKILDITCKLTCGITESSQRTQLENLLDKYYPPGPIKLDCTPLIFEIRGIENYETKFVYILLAFEIGNWTTISYTSLFERDNIKRLKYWFYSDKLTT